MAVAGEADEVSEAGGQVQLPCRSRGWQPAVAGVLVAAAQTCTVPDPTKPPSCERVVCGQVHQDGPFYYEHLEALDRVVAYWAHAGDYFSAAVRDATQIAEADAALADVIRRLRRAKSKLPISRAAALEDVIARLARV